MVFCYFETKYSSATTKNLLNSLMSGQIRLISPTGYISYLNFLSLCLFLLHKVCACYMVNSCFFKIVSLQKSKSKHL